MPTPEVLGVTPGARLDIRLHQQPEHQMLGVKIDSSQPLGNPFVADRDGYYSLYVVPAAIDLVVREADGRTYTLSDVLVLDPRVADLEQRVSALFLAAEGA
jgi:hypothetical protein